MRLTETLCHTVDWSFIMKLYFLSAQVFSVSLCLDVCCRLADKLLAPPAADSDGESDGSDRVPVPNFQNSFSQAFEKALLQLDTGGAPPPPQAPVEPGLYRPPSATQLVPLFSNSLPRCSSTEEKGGKKKKKKQKLLFSTAMVHTK